MNINEILDLDCRIEENEQLLNKALKKIPPLAKCEGKVPLEEIEKAISYMSTKYAIMIQYICPTYIKGAAHLYSTSIKTIYPYQWLGNVYGQTLYETLAKCAIKMYNEIRKGSVKLQSEIEREKVRKDEIEDLY